MKKSSNKKNLPPEELFDQILKNLRLAIDYKVDDATRALFSVFGVITDRFLNEEGKPKECHDDNEWIGKRARLTKNTVEPAISWLVKHRFLKAEHRVKVGTPRGSEVKIFASNKEAWVFVKKHRSTGGSCKDPHRVFLPQQKKPTLDDLGLELVDKNNGIYRVRGTPDSDAREPKNYDDENQNLDNIESEIDKNTTENWGARLDASDETSKDQNLKDETFSNETDEMVSNSNHPISPSEPKPLTAREALRPFTAKDLKTDKSPLGDANFAICMMLLEALRTTGFLGAANRLIGKSILIRSVIPKISVGHFIYAAVKFNENGGWPQWFEELIFNYESEIEGLELGALNKFVKELSNVQ